MNWASNRTTTRVEDEAYSLLGLFNVNMPLIYGEGRNAFQRLQEEIVRKTTDDSIFAWRLPRHFSHVGSGLLAPSPRALIESGTIVRSSNSHWLERNFELTHSGVVFDAEASMDRGKFGTDAQYEFVILKLNCNIEDTKNDVHGPVLLTLGHVKATYKPHFVKVLAHDLGKMHESKRLRFTHTEQINVSASLDRVLVIVPV